jgi:hypothetical protein
VEGVVVVELVAPKENPEKLHAVFRIALISKRIRIQAMPSERKLKFYRYIYSYLFFKWHKKFITVPISIKT